MMPRVLLLVCATLWALCLYALVRARRAWMEGERHREQLRRMGITRIADARGGDRVLVSGRVAGLDGAVVPALFTGRAALHARSTAQTGAGYVRGEWVRRVDGITLDDGSGTIATVRTVEAVVQMSDARVDSTTLPPEAKDELDGAGLAYVYGAAPSPFRSGTTGGAFHLRESVLCAGERVSVIGAADPGGPVDRNGTRMLSLSSDGGGLLVFDPDDELIAARLQRGALRLAKTGVVVFGIAALCAAWCALHG